MEYEDWITDASTWLSLADKCVAHHLFFLATDFYSLGIIQDVNAYKQPMLWYRFAKACNRCGRISDAQLSVRVRLDIDDSTTRCNISSCVNS